MDYISNPEIMDFLARVKKTCDADSYGNAARQFRKSLIEHGLIDAGHVTERDPLAPLPVASKAIQLGLFENVITARRNRNYVETANTRYKLSVTVWDHERIDFKRADRVTWQVNCPLWDRANAAAAVDQLLGKGSITDQTAVMVREAIDDLDPSFLIGIPRMSAIGYGTRWVAEHFCAVKIDNKQPGTVILGSNQVGFSGDVWDDYLPGGGSLPRAKNGKVIAQMRLSSAPGLADWATAPL